MNSEKTPIIILIGGASGTGKTTLANVLVQELGLAHHISTGFIREVARAILPEPASENMTGYSFDAWKHISEQPENNDRRVIDGAMRQSELLFPAIKACIDRSRREGAPLVLEGSHMLPGLIDAKSLGANLFCILDVPDRQQMLKRALGPTHSSRDLDNVQLNSIVTFQDACLNLAKMNNVSIIDNTNLETAIGLTKSLI
ncbi:hypothetical protein FIM02_01030 [SAR202 cluster bacterium AD-802-E10_MRT_200m]|nr:hypothetical protein [SAR202 cluster bacterium AD-802-E10_MRT_200m]